MPKIIHSVDLRETHRQQLKTMLNRGRYTASMYKRMRILQLLDQGLTQREVAEQVGCGRSTVQRVCETFSAEGFEAVFSRKPVSGRPKRLDKEGQQRLIELAGTEAPDGQDRWTLHGLVEELVDQGVTESISTNTVQRILRECGISLKESATSDEPIP